MGKQALSVNFLERNMQGETAPAPAVHPFLTIALSARTGAVCQGSPRPSGTGQAPDETRRREKCRSDSAQQRRLSRFVAGYLFGVKRRKSSRERRGLPPHGALLWAILGVPAPLLGGHGGNRARLLPGRLDGPHRPSRRSSTHQAGPSKEGHQGWWQPCPCCPDPQGLILFPRSLGQITRDLEGSGLSGPQPSSLLVSAMSVRPRLPENHLLRFSDQPGKPCELLIAQTEIIFRCCKLLEDRRCKIPTSGTFCEGLRAQAGLRRGFCGGGFCGVNDSSRITGGSGKGARGHGERSLS